MSTTPPDPSSAGAAEPGDTEPGDEAGRDTEPEPETKKPPRKRRPRRAVDPGRGPEPVWQAAAWEDDPRAWGERGDDQDKDGDERILRERPPHW